MKMNFRLKYEDNRGMWRNISNQNRFFFFTTWNSGICQTTCRLLKVRWRWHQSQSELWLVACVQVLPAEPSDPCWASWTPHTHWACPRESPPTAASTSSGQSVHRHLSNSISLSKICLSNFRPTSVCLPTYTVGFSVCPAWVCPTSVCVQCLFSLL